jgi:hypothetical protein
MKGKLELTKEDIIKLLPEWLSDLHTRFLLRLADKLPLQHAWDYTIEQMPGKEPAY